LARRLHRDKLGTEPEKEGAMAQFKTLVVTTDFSETAAQAFEPALSLAEKFGAKILLLYVEEDRLPPFAGDYPALYGAPVVELLETHRRRAEEELGKLSRQRFAGRVDVEAITRSGIAHREVVQLAEEREADMIVMATHGRGFLAHAVMGSTTERVIRHAPCPVLAVRCRVAQST
jgi:nucleotide-binding universal stress UspA family protein